MKNVTQVLATLALAVVFLAVQVPLALAGEFPLRPKYPDSVPVTTEKLEGLYGSAIIVDTRNSAEYGVIRIKGAKNILVGR